MSTITVHGIYDGKVVRILPSETPPITHGETRVKVTFDVETNGRETDSRDSPLNNLDLDELKDAYGNPLSETAKILLATGVSSRVLGGVNDDLPTPKEAGERLDALREKIGPIGINVEDLIAEGRR